VNVFLVSYDVHDKSDARRKKVRSEIRNAFPRYYEHLELSVYLIGTSRRPSEVRDELERCLERGDKLYVGEIESSAWYGAPGLKDWINETRAG
jgi:hypothetical protein